MTGSLQKRGKIYYAIIELNMNGVKRQKWVSTKCIKKGDAQKVLNQLLCDMDNNVYVEPTKILFTDFLLEWLDNNAKSSIEQTTYEGYKTIIKKHVIPYFKNKNLTLSDLKTIHLQKYIDKKFKDGLSANYLRRHYANIKKCIDYAVKLDIIKDNPIVNVTMPKNKGYSANFYSVEELEKLLEITKGTICETAVYLTAMYGFRRGEVLGLRWKDVDFEDGTITICNTRTKVLKEVVKRPKTKSSLRTLPLIEDVATYLKKLQVTQKENKLLFGKEYKNSDYICRYEDGTPTNIVTMESNFSKLLADNKMQHIRFHDIRHSTASYLLKNGVSLKEIQMWLGHANISTTANIYIHLDSEMKKNTANTINQIFSKSK
jgi:integrase